MSHIHLSRELLKAVSLGQLPARQLVEIGLEHLQGLCPACAAELKAWQQEVSNPARAADRAFGIIPKLLAHQIPRLLLQARAAQEDLDMLLALPPGERLIKVRRARRRFRTQGLLLLLLEECRLNLLCNPKEALQVADLGVEVGLRAIQGDAAPDLLVLAYAERGNACRATGDIGSSTLMFKLARNLAQIEGVTHPGVLARLDSVEASLLKELGRVEKAESLLERALVLYSVVGDSSELRRIHVQRSALFAQAARWEEVAGAARSALLGVTRESDPQIYYWARFNLATCLLRDRRLDEALALLEADENEVRYRREPLLDARYLWFRGRAAVRQGRPGDARNLLVRALEVFQGAGARADSELVARELALV